jgi:hypothetical protein
VGIPKRKLDEVSHDDSPDGTGGTREYGSCSSKPLATVRIAEASDAVSAKIETQSRERQAGTTPRALIRPRVGFSPMILLNMAGTRPEPAVSVPSAKVTFEHRKIRDSYLSYDVLRLFHDLKTVITLTKPLATATADPELEPPEIEFELKTLAQVP